MARRIPRSAGVAPHTRLLAQENLPLRDGPGCEHVAALLTAWIRAPGDFAVPAQEASPRVPTSPDQAPDPTSKASRSRASAGAAFPAADAIRP